MSSKTINATIIIFNLKVFEVIEKNAILQYLCTYLYVHNNFFQLEYSIKSKSKTFVMRNAIDSVC